MNPLRSHIARMMLVTAVAAWDFAAMRGHWEIGSRVNLFATAIFFASAPLAALYRRGRARAFWIGVGGFGWLYAFVVLPPAWSDTLGRGILTTRILEELYPTIVPQPSAAEPDVEVYDKNSSGYMKAAPSSLWNEYYRRAYWRAGQSLCWALFGLLGGFIAWMIHGPRPTDPSRGGGPAWPSQST